MRSAKKPLLLARWLTQPAQTLRRRLREKQLRDLAREGYEFYAEELLEFAELTAKAASEAIGPSNWTW